MFTTVPADAAQRLVQVYDAIHSAKRVQWLASQTRDAGAVFRAERILENLYAECDALAAADPGADREARLIRARRNV